jgi:ABC-2 type transport system ATP-binding protein
MTTAPIIQTRGLTKRFGDFTAVDRLDLAVEPGSIFAFLGGNGSGKSTTIRMLIGLLQPTEGEITVDGIDVIHTPRRVRDHIGYMGQKVSLYQGLSLRENVEFYAGLFGLQGDRLERRWATLRDRFALYVAVGVRP